MGPAGLDPLNVLRTAVLRPPDGRHDYGDLDEKGVEILFSFVSYSYDSC